MPPDNKIRTLGNKATFLSLFACATREYFFLFCENIWKADELEIKNVLKFKMFSQ